MTQAGDDDPPRIRDRRRVTETAHVPVRSADGTGNGRGGMDGRALRRLRNIDAVHRAILGMLEEGHQLTVESVAERAGVAGRSLYRYYDDLQAAVVGAFRSRLEAAGEQMTAAGPIDPSLPLDLRVDHLVRRRLGLLAILGVAHGRISDDDADPWRRRLDEQVIACFGTEIGRLAPEVRHRIVPMLANLFRVSTLRSLSRMFGGDVHDTVRATTFAVESLLDR